MNLTQLLEKLRFEEDFMRNVTHWETIAPSPGEYEPFPDSLDPRLREAYARRGIRQLYSHQRKALDAAQRGENVAVVTPTASGKTLCYNLPVLDAILRDDSSRALYLFPTKALSADQVAELYEVIEEAGIAVRSYTYDGDTQASARKAIRSAGHIVVTNPDMLHGGILPHHTKWVKLFENLKYVVIDEIHSYRGVFGSHLCNVLRRLRRLCDFYGSHPQFICCSATIANPGELAEQLIGQPVTLIDHSGAPVGERHFIFYNPPVVNRQLGIRKSALLEAKRVALRLIGNDISTIVFARSRIQVEVMVNYLKEATRDALGSAGSIRGYRGGYLPNARREIERGLREGRVRGVVSTNALELGIDIGSLEACVMVGYPGTISSTWQQSGRAGRRNALSATFLVASSSPLSQFIVGHPEYFFGHSPEHSLINPDNLYILLAHLKCASYELPFQDGERYGGNDIAEVLNFLEEAGVLRHVGATWYWSAEDFPAAGMSLRSASNENFLIVDITRPEHHEIIGEMDRYTVPMLLHEQAIYLQDGRQYQVEKLDFDDHKGYVRQVDVDYYTDADLQVGLRVLDVLDERPEAGCAWGEVLVTSLVTMFKKMKMDTHENLGFGPVHLPELEMHTTAFWLSLAETPAGMTQEEVQSGLIGLANLYAMAAPAYLMCDPQDICVKVEVRAPFTGLPTIYLYDAYPGGIGFSEKLFTMQGTLLAECRLVAQGCGCLNGCPSCVGPDADKLATLRLLDALTLQVAEPG